MSYRIIIDRGAGREMDKLPKDVQRRLWEAIDSLADEPRPPRVSRMEGADAYRIRVGAYRIVYSIQDQILLVLIVKVAHRKDIYKAMETVKRRLRY